MFTICHLYSNLVLYNIDDMMLLVKHSDKERRWFCGPLQFFGEIDIYHSSKKKNNRFVVRRNGGGQGVSNHERLQQTGRNLVVQARYECVPRFSESLFIDSASVPRCRCPKEPRAGAPPGGSCPSR